MAVRHRKREQREPLLNRIAGVLFGYDFFSSYAQSDGLEYAQNLAARLQDDGFECFLDRESFVKGENWRMAGRRALNKTQRLVLIASPNALRSKPVLLKLEIFTGRGRRVIPIDFGGTLDRKQHDSPLFRHISEDDLFIPESREQLASGRPSDHVVTDLGRSFHIERQDKKQLR